MSEGENVVTLNDVQAVIGNEGYEVSQESGGVLRVRDVDSSIVIRVVLENNILFCTVPCTTVSGNELSPKLMQKMLAADNGISTSGFQLYEKGNGSLVVTLNNFCKLQAMGEDDRDDILSCLGFLVVDVCAAKELLGTPA